MQNSALAEETSAEISVGMGLASVGVKKPTVGIPLSETVAAVADVVAVAAVGTTVAVSFVVAASEPGA